MEAPLEQRPIWTDIVPLLATESIPALAARFNLAPGLIASAMKRVGHARKPVVSRNAEPSDDSLDTGDATPPPASAPRRHHGLKSPLDAFAHLIGAIPDAEVAAQAGVSRGALYQYRMRRGLAGFQGKKAESGDRARPAVQQATPPSPPAVERAPVAAVAPTNGASYAWTVTVERGGRESTWIVLGHDIAEVSAKAGQALPGAEVIGIARFLQALV